MKQYFRNRQLCFPFILEERQTAAKDYFVFLLASMRKIWWKPDYNTSFPPILPHGSQKRDKLRQAIAHFSMGCNMDAKSSKNKANKMGGSKKKAKKKRFFFSGIYYVEKSLSC